MNPDLPGVWMKLEGMLRGLLVSLPNLGGLLAAQASREAEVSAQDRTGGR